MTIIKGPNGLIISDIVANNLVQQVYIGYSRKVAIKKFKAYIADLKTDLRTIKY